MRLHVETPADNRVFLAQHTFEQPMSSCLLKVLRQFSFVYFQLAVVVNAHPVVRTDTVLKVELKL